MQMSKKKQYRIALRNCGLINPEDIYEYISVGGYEALGKVLSTMSGKQVVDLVKSSGLRGRGGAGFPTGLKWEITRKEKVTPKYLFCNADEGDPGAFMDRSILEGDPHSVLEGMAIAGYAIGASQGYIYIRAEYPLAIKSLETAISQAKELGLLGENILGSGVNFDIKLKIGAGAFVCGEETALIHSAEGRRGEPSLKPPYPAQSGYWGKPTCVNNVETFANISPIILKGPAWFTSIGTKKSPGTKVFALAGDINNVGLVEVPMGTTLREIVYDLGGGIKDNRKLKAVQTGGPSGGMIPEKFIDTPIDYENLKKIDSIMGSGGMIVMDERSCMVDVSKFYLNFTRDESCGRCTPCRIGTTRMYEILEKISNGDANMSDLNNLWHLSNMVKATSLCGLGQSAPNPVISSMRNFMEEYESHALGKTCPAGKCKALLKYSIDAEKCIGCTACARKCPVECITGSPRQPHVIDQERCIKCGSCYEACKFGAVIKPGT
jgi:NADH:ubiquinone oxidoreductase subunit F (NADH-binding)/NAD-dependent dihydropyrimidine dehydrogenase PreA subunit